MLYTRIYLSISMYIWIYMFVCMNLPVLCINNVIDIHYHVVIYNRVILLSLNNTVEFF